MEVKFCERVNGNGLFSLQEHNINDIIHKLNGDITNKPCKYSIEISENKHIIDKYGIYMNHSFTPNCIIVNNNIVAIKKINKGDELHFNYNQNETKMAAPFKIDDVSVSGKRNI